MARNQHAQKGALVNLKNYTSNIDADTTIARIERMLVCAGASGVQKLYEDGNVSSLVFKIILSPGQPESAIRLPANVPACIESMWTEYVKSSPKGRKTKEDFHDQATRTAWKLTQDWVEVQMSLIHLGQVEPGQVFLAYVLIGRGNATIYDKVREAGYKALLPEKT